MRKENQSDAETGMTDVVEPGEPTVCALEGCDNPLPLPVFDEQGRRKGGRPSTYCGKAHADAASRARRAVQTATVLDPLAEVHRILEALPPVVQPLLTALDQVRAQLGSAEQGALGQVQQAEENVKLAQAETDDALSRADQADRARTRALIQARDDQAARAAAEKAAEQSKVDAEQSKREAWARVAEHERARGAAEAARTAAIESRDELAASFRHVKDQLESARETHTRLQQERDETRIQLQELKTDYSLALDRLRNTESRLKDTGDQLGEAQKDLAQVRHTETSLRHEVTHVQGRLAEEHTARRLAETQAESAEKTLAVTREELVEARARFDRLIEQFSTKDTAEKVAISRSELDQSTE